ncbi:hypothetical protein JB92DRAFT_2704847 [Gautieria morchelliformis]|nr:hypothetical protein JB92DRAFT_2704847 [Gautieria morchelliformis]
MSRKRKYTRRSSPDYNAGGDSEDPSSRDYPSSSTPLFIQGHEATITRGRPDLVDALTAHDRGGGKGTGGLIKWPGEGLADEQEVWDERLISRCRFLFGTFTSTFHRYDARLLLTSLPTAASGGPYSPPTPPSPAGWSDLPSDSEDTFFFSPPEIEDFQREKRRKLMDAGREARLRAMRESDPDPARDFSEAKELWGGDEEEPDGAQRTLMERTARHLLTSPNSGQLEMRILANHGSDQRFAFLRGRWRNAWQAIKLVAKLEKEKSEREAMGGSTNNPGGLVAYGDTDDSDAEHNDHVQGKPGQAQTARLKEADDTEKEARRARARDWIRQRKAERGPSP